MSSNGRPPGSRARPVTSEPERLIHGLRADTWARLFMVIVVALIFVWLNYEVMDFVKTAFAADRELAKTAPAATRLVTPQVLHVLIGATAVQVGVATLALMNYLFPKPSK